MCCLLWDKSVLSFGVSLLGSEFVLGCLIMVMFVFICISMNFVKGFGLIFLNLMILILRSGGIGDCVWVFIKKFYKFNIFILN